MSVTVLKIDQHTEIVNGASVLVPHVFRSEPHPGPVGERLRVGGEGALLEGDRLQNEANPDHVAPRAGTFASPPPGTGRFPRAGQSLLKVDGIAVMTALGTVETCCEVEAEVSCRSAAILGGKPLLLVDGSPVLTGR